MGPCTRSTVTKKHYVVCPKCSSIYEQNDCILTRANGSIIESKTCCHVATPEHPHRNRRNACGCVLMKRQKTKHGVVLIPRKVYPYRSIIKSLQVILNKPGYIDLCEEWRHRCANDELLGDVYDGEVWRSFNSEEFNYFLSVPHSYLLTLNVDWFRPFACSWYCLLNWCSIPDCSKLTTTGAISGRELDSSWNSTWSYQT